MLSASGLVGVSSCRFFLNQQERAHGIEEEAFIYVTHRYACRADAEKAATETIAQRSVYHQLDVRIHEYPRYGRGVTEPYE